MGLQVWQLFLQNRNIARKHDFAPAATPEPRRTLAPYKGSALEGKCAFNKPLLPSLRLRFRRLHRTRTPDTSNLQFNVCVSSFLHIMETVHGNKHPEKNGQLLETQKVWRDRNVFRELSSRKKKGAHAHTYTHARVRALHAYTRQGAQTLVLACRVARFGSTLPRIQSSRLYSALNNLSNKRNAQSPTANRADTHFPSSSYS